MKQEQNTKVERESLENKIGWFPITFFGLSCLLAGAGSKSFINELYEGKYELAAIDGAITLGAVLCSYFAGKGLAHYSYFKKIK